MRRIEVGRRSRVRAAMRAVAAEVQQPGLAAGRSGGQDRDALTIITGAANGHVDGRSDESGFATGLTAETERTTTVSRSRSGFVQ